jgi:hypothetical protein
VHIQQEGVRSATIPSKPLAGMRVRECVCACVRVHTAGGCKVWRHPNEASGRFET